MSAATAHLKQAKLSFGLPPRSAGLCSSGSTESSQTVGPDSRQAGVDAFAGTHPQQQQQSCEQDATSEDVAQPAAGPGAAVRLRTRPKQSYDLFLVYDFEATCDKPGPMPVQELIELACVVRGASCSALPARGCRMPHCCCKSGMRACCTAATSKAGHVTVVASFRVAMTCLQSAPLQILDAATLQVVAEQQIFVRPSEYPALTDFCKQLTHITQAQ